MADYLFIIPLFLAVAAGFYLGQRSRIAMPKAKQGTLAKEYFTGLDYLISERTDEAIESFVRALEINSDTIPAHLALAKLFRRKGDVDQAIKIHQTLLARTDLGRADFLRVQMALARDYDAVGLLDRAENLLTEIIAQHPPRQTRRNALTLLIKLYEKEGEWQQALDTAQQLSNDEAREIRHELAHYSCELADQALLEKDYKQVQARAKQALSYDPNAVRASLLIAAAAIEQQQWKTAIKALRNVVDQDPAFVSETIQPLAHCYEALGQQHNFIEYLKQTMGLAPSTSAMLAIAEQIKDDRGVYRAGAFITEELKKRPSIKGFNKLIDLHIAHGGDSARDSLRVLRGLTGQLELSKPVYQCSQCGFAGRALLWQCPSCKTWGSTRPIQGLEGE